MGKLRAPLLDWKEDAGDSSEQAGETGPEGPGFPETQVWGARCTVQPAVQWVSLTPEVGRALKFGRGYREPETDSGFCPTRSGCSLQFPEVSGRIHLPPPELAYCGARVEVHWNSVLPAGWVLSGVTGQGSEMETKVA